MSENGQETDEIEITPEMIEAGEAALDDNRDILPEDSIIRAVYIAMRSVAPR